MARALPCRPSTLSAFPCPGGRSTVSSADESGGGAITRTSVLIVEDNDILAGELQLVAGEHGLTAKPPVHTYHAALKAIDTGDFECCVLDLNLGKFTEDPFGPGREGRQLLALLGTKNIPTVVYSGHVTEEKTIRALHPGAVCVDKLESCERVIEVLRDLCCNAAG